MFEPFEPLITEPEHRLIRAHYERGGALIDRHFHGTPLVSLTHPRGLGHAGAFHKYLEAPKAVPASLATVEVWTRGSGRRRYLALSTEAMRWLAGARYAVEFQGWSPTATDPQRAAYGRILFHPGADTGHQSVLAATRELMLHLGERGLRSIALVDGGGGTALWIPFDDGPEYAPLAAWLRAFAQRMADTLPELVTTETFGRDRTGRVHIGTISNHPGMSSLLPYSLRGTPALDVALPCAPDDLEAAFERPITAVTFGAWLDAHGDLFGQLRAAVPQQRFVDVERLFSTAQSTGIDLDLAPYDPHARIINAALAVLDDGNAHSIDEILEEAIRRDLVPKTTSRRYLYVALHNYVLRTLGAGRVPHFVQVPGTSEFRLNRPADDWPDVALPPTYRWIEDADVRAMAKRLRSTAVGGDPAEFERAACEAFDLLGFLANHVGGNGEPDGVLIAPLGARGYRVVLECKTAAPFGTVSNPRPEEAAKFREGAGAQYSILLGPAFAHTVSLEDELKTHGVALWTVADLTYALEQQIGPYQLRAALAPGYAERPLQLIAWEREHGRRKRVEVIAEVIWRLGWQTQVRLAKGVPVGEMPAITTETLFLLADDDLMRQGVAAGASRTEAEEAIRLLVARGIMDVTDGACLVLVPRGG